MEKIKKKAGDSISYADLYTLAGVEAISHMGGPDILWRAGRSDRGEDAVTPDGRLPNADTGPPGADKSDAAHLRQVFGRMGFDDRDIVALSGAHALGRCHTSASGFDGERASETFCGGSGLGLSRSPPPHPPPCSPRPLVPHAPDLQQRVFLPPRGPRLVQARVERAVPVRERQGRLADDAAVGRGTRRRQELQKVRTASHAKGTPPNLTLALPAAQVRQAVRGGQGPLLQGLLERVPAPRGTGLQQPGVRALPVAPPSCILCMHTTFY
jgi:hypothetical protein